MYNQENAYYSSCFKSPAGIDCEAMRFQGLGAILLWLAHLALISHDKPRHCAAVTKPSSTRKHQSNTPTLSLIITLIIYCLYQQFIVFIKLVGSQVFPDLYRFSNYDMKHTSLPNTTVLGFISIFPVSLSKQLSRDEKHFTT